MLRSLFFCLGLLLWIAGNWGVRPPPPRLGGMEIAPPIPVQLVGAFGDRYLAANIGVWRSIVVGGAALPDYSLNALKQTQVDAAWLNPAHEDNYYIASAVLPWEGYVDEAQYILEEAVKARRDILPPFFLAFNYFYFVGEVDSAVSALNRAAEMADDPGSKAFFIALAARWQTDQDDVEKSASLMRKITGASRNKRVAQFVDARVTRLEGLGRLRQAAANFVRDRHRPPRKLEELVTEGYLEAIPIDPVGTGYAMSGGKVIMARRGGSYNTLKRESR